MYRCLALGLVACTGSPSPALTCLDENPATSEPDFASDMWHIACPVAPGAPAPPCDPPTVADLEAQCAAEGFPCDDTIVVGRDAAVCLAEAEGLEVGIDGLHADLIYHSGHQRPIWSVSNVLTQETDGASSGETASLDAASGELLDLLEWQAVP
jgi:hypothetical protein